MPYLLFFEKWQNFKLSSAANYRWRYKGWYWNMKAFSLNLNLQIKNGWYMENMEKNFPFKRQNEQIIGIFLPFSFNFYFYFEQALWKALNFNR